MLQFATKYHFLLASCTIHCMSRILKDEILGPHNIPFPYYSIFILDYSL